MKPRFVLPQPRIDAVRGWVAIERGPLVCCFEGHDQPRNGDMLDLAIDTHRQARGAWAAGLLGGTMTVTAAGSCSLAAGPALYQPLAAGASAAETEHVTLTAIPSFAWANRVMGSMRVWVPQASVLTS